MLENTSYAQWWVWAPDSSCQRWSVRERPWRTHLEKSFAWGVVMNDDNDPWNSSLAWVNAEAPDSGFFKSTKCLDTWWASSYLDRCQKLLEKSLMTIKRHTRQRDYFPEMLVTVCAAVCFMNNCACCMGLTNATLTEHVCLDYSWTAFLWNRGEEKTHGQRIHRNRTEDKNMFLSCSQCSKDS